MFNIGELVVYSAHGVCKVDDICDKTFGGKTRTYYVIHPINDTKLKISIPVQKDNLFKIMDAQVAERIIASFSKPGIEWIDDVKQRNKKYHHLVESGNREEISKVANTLIRRSAEAKKNKKHVSDQDRKLLTTIKSVLFGEMALALHTTKEDISNRVKKELDYQAI